MTGSSPPWNRKGSVMSNTLKEQVERMLACIAQERKLRGRIPPSEELVEEIFTQWLNGISCRPGEPIHAC